MGKLKVELTDEFEFQHRAEPFWKVYSEFSDFQDTDARSKTTAFCFENSSECSLFYFKAICDEVPTMCTDKVEFEYQYNSIKIGKYQRLESSGFQPSAACSFFDDSVVT